MKKKEECEIALQKIVEEINEKELILKDKINEIHDTPIRGEYSSAIKDMQCFYARLCEVKNLVANIRALRYKQRNICTEILNMEWPVHKSFRKSHREQHKGITWLEVLKEAFIPMTFLKKPILMLRYLKGKNSGGRNEK